MAPEPLLTIDGVVKSYGGLRPLRIQRLTIAAGERVALVGFDRPTAEVFVNLVTGQSLPESGTIAIRGQRTSEISDSSAWLEFVGQFGIMSDRAPLLEPLTAIQNLAMPFTLSIDPLADDFRRAAESLAQTIGLPHESWDGPVASLSALAKMRVRLGRALALGPLLLLLEHVNAALDATDADTLAAAIVGASRHHGAAVAALTVDERFARAVAQRVLRWEPASGRLAERRGWFRSRVG